MDLARESQDMRVNLGCGPKVVNGWVNVDYSLGARLSSIPLLGPIVDRIGLFGTKWDPRILIHDLTTRFPWQDNSVDVCYSSHTVEHLSREQGVAFVRESFRVLKQGGICRIVVPDLSEYIQKYLSGDLAAERFVEALGVLYGGGKHGLKRSLAPLIEFPHKCMYDVSSMVRLFTEAGFTASKRDPFDSGIADIRGVEMADRTSGAVVVEGVKP